MKIKFEDLRLKQSYRAMMLWEAVYKQPFSLDGTVMSLTVFLWCIIEVNNPGLMSWEEYLAWIDEYPEDYDKLCKWLSADQQRQGELMPEEKTSKKAKKKARKKAS